MIIYNLNLIQAVSIKLTNLKRYIDAFFKYVGILLLQIVNHFKNVPPLVAYSRKLIANEMEFILELKHPSPKR